MQKIHDERAQGLVEFSLIAMVLLLIMLGTVDYARFLYFDTAIRSAARVGAEVAGNHCTPICGQNMTTDDYVVQAAVCEANIGLKPQPASVVGCDGCHFMTGSPTGCNDPYNLSSGTYNATDPCPSSSCTQDVNVTPICPAGSTGATAACQGKGGTSITVTVGYSFKPVLPLLTPFFPETSCYTGDSTSTNHHTICATAQGMVSQ